MSAEYPGSPGRFGDARPSPKQPSDWRHGTHTNFSEAQKSMNASNAHRAMSQTAHEAITMETNRQNAMVHEALVAKVNQSKQLFELLSDRIRSVETSIMLSKKSCLELQEAAHDKEAPLQLCESRLDLRSRSRPARESKRDPFETALEEERGALKAAQKKLADSTRRTDKMIQELGQMHSVLTEDLKAKTQSLRIDQDVVQTAASMGKKTFHAPLDEPASQESAKMPVAVLYAGVHEEQEHRRQFDTINLGRRAKKLEEQAQALRDDSAAVMRLTAGQCAAANARTKARMDASVSELGVMVQRLKQTIQEQERQIAHTTHTLCQTACHTSAHDAPFHLATTRQKLRQQRPEQENIADPVRDALDKQVSSLQRNFELLERRQNDEKNALSELRRVLANMKDDLADKGKALDTDAQCQRMRVTDMENYQSPEQSAKSMTTGLRSLGVTLQSPARSKSAKRGAPALPSIPLDRLKIGTFANRTGAGFLERHARERHGSATAR